YGVDVVVRRRGDQPDPRSGVPHLGHPRIHLVTRQLATLTGLGALGHLDLDVGAVGQIVAGHAEPAGRHLLDRTAPLVTVVVRIEPGDALAALTGVRPGAEPVHRDRQRLVRLGGDRAVAHRAGGEPLDDLAGRFDLFDRHRRADALLEFEQTAQRGHPLALVVDEPGVLLEDLVLTGAGRVLQLEHRVRVEQVVLTLPAPLVFAADLQFAVRPLLG